MVVAFEDASAVAAAGVAHDEAEPVPTFLDVDVGVCLLARQAEDRPLVVDHERHVVVHESMQAPVAGLGTRDVEPAVVAELRLCEEGRRVARVGGAVQLRHLVHAFVRVVGKRDLRPVDVRRALAVAALAVGDAPAPRRRVAAYGS